MNKGKLLILILGIGLAASLAEAIPRPGANPSFQPSGWEEFEKTGSSSKGPFEVGASAGAKSLGPCNVVRGDIDGNKILDLRDVVLLSDCVFAGSGRCATCYVGDTNCDRQISPPDIVKLIIAIYRGQLVNC